MKLVGLSRVSIYRLRKQGDLVAPIKCPIRRVLWRRADVVRWVEQQRLAA
jgi:predicted DNA-binding transcriptional regulator AlpA